MQSQNKPVPHTNNPSPCRDVENVHTSLTTVELLLWISLYILKTTHPKVASGAGVPQYHQVGVGQLPLVRHPQQHALFEVSDPQLHVNLLIGVADVPGQVEFSTWVEGHTEGHGERWERARGGRFGHIHGVHGRLIRSHQDHHESSQSCEVHEGDVLKTDVPVEDPHFFFCHWISIQQPKFLCQVLANLLPDCAVSSPACFIKDSSPASCLFLSRLIRLHLLREIGLYSLSPGVNHDPEHLPTLNWSKFNHGHYQWQSV